MSKFTVQLALKLLVSFSLLIGFSSSAVAANDANSDEESMRVVSSDKRGVVFGKFRLLKNGSETKLGTGLFGNVAALRLYRAEDQEEFTVKVGENGEFSRKLSPGEYYVEYISFKHQGETIRPETNFMFTVSGGHRASYIGTITLETTFSGGYNGMKGSFDRFTVSNDCATDCDRRLSELGLADAAMTTSLATWETSVALNNR